MKALILAGGSGTRLRPLTHTGPKQLIPIANKPVLFYGIEDITEAGIKETGIILGNNMPEKIKKAVGDGSKFGLKVTYIHQGEPKGLAHAILISENYLRDTPFVMYLGDNILKFGIADFVKDFEDSEFDARILLAKVPNPQQFGVAELDKKGMIIRLVEKPKHIKSDLALVGVYLFKKPVFKAVKAIKPSWRNELEITDAIQWLIDNGYKVDSHIVNGWWKDTGKPEDILEANRLLLDDIEPCIKGNIDDTASLHGKIVIGEGTAIKEGTIIRGPVVIGRNCEIGPEAYIGPYTSVGNDTIIRGGEIESSVIIGEAKIECNKRIVDSLIGRNAMIVSNANSLPSGYKFVIGENTFVKI